jgi:hypothetical protein
VHCFHKVFNVKDMMFRSDDVQSKAVPRAEEPHQILVLQFAHQKDLVAEGLLRGHHGCAPSGVKVLLHCTVHPTPPRSGDLRRNAATEVSDDLDFARVFDISRKTEPCELFLTLFLIIAGELLELLMQSQAVSQIKALHRWSQPTADCL